MKNIEKFLPAFLEPFNINLLTFIVKSADSAVQGLVGVGRSPHWITWEREFWPQDQKWLRLGNRHGILWKGLIYLYIMTPVG